MTELINSIKERKVILFAGAGLSMNLGLPSWGQLIDFIAKELGYDPKIYSSFGDYLSLSEYYIHKKGSIGPLRSWMDREWHKDVDISKSTLYKDIVELDFPIIYTTNYDRWIEYSYDKFKSTNSYTKVIGVSDIPKIEDSKTQIIKFHGDFDIEESIVLTETHYFERLNFETALDIKLRADALGKSLLFIGYSLSDINLRLLLYKLDKLWKGDVLSSVRPKSYIFLTRPNPVQEAIFIKRGITPIVATSHDPGKAIAEFIEQLKSV
jgi:hypothetical protein